MNYIALSLYHSQHYNKFQGTSEYSSKTSFAAMVEYDKAHPATDPKMKIPNKEVFKYPQFSLEGKKILYKETQNFYSQTPSTSGIKDPSEKLIGNKKTE